MTATMPDVSEGPAVDDPVQCEALDLDPAGEECPCPDVAVWDLMLACPDGTVRARHACARHGGLAIAEQRVPCALHPLEHYSDLIAIYPRRSL